jgi:hypothetical protein
VEIKRKAAAIGGDAAQGAAKGRTPAFDSLKISQTRGEIGPRMISSLIGGESLA